MSKPRTTCGAPNCLICGPRGREVGEIDPHLHDGLRDNTPRVPMWIVALFIVVGLALAAAGLWAFVALVRS